MRIRTIVLGAALLGTGELAAQSPRDLLQIEIAAARNAVSDRNIARNMIRVDAAFAAPQAVPGTPTSQQRPADRTKAIEDAVLVPSTYRRPYGETLLIMSQPQVQGDAAQVTTTLYRVTPGGQRLFETCLVTLRHSAGGWQVESATRLGGG